MENPYAAIQRQYMTQVGPLVIVTPHATCPFLLWDGLAFAIGN